MGTLYLAPGYTDEVIHLFRAGLAPFPGAQRGDRDERIALVRLTPEAFEQQIREGAITDSKTLAAWMLHKLPPP